MNSNARNRRISDLPSRELWDRDAKVDDSSLFPALPLHVRIGEIGDGSRYLNTLGIINEAVVLSSDGDLILVQEGSYNEVIYDDVIALSIGTPNITLAADPPLANVTNQPFDKSFHTYQVWTFHFSRWSNP